jgi:23S rRNA pseudouridine2605 synthase
MSSLGLEVNRLIRVSFGPFQLAEMEPGDVEPVKRRVLMEQLGPRLSKELGLEAAAEEERAEQRAARKRGWRGPSLDDEDDL